MNSTSNNNLNGNNSSSVHYYHHHTVEIAPNQGVVALPLSRKEKIRNVIADILILLGTLMAIAATAALILQTAGIVSPLLPILANLLIPSIAAILAGTQLTRNELHPKPRLNMSTVVPGLALGL